MTEFQDAMIEAYTGILESNEKTLEWLCTAEAAEAYPNLYKLLHRYGGSLQNRIEQLHRYSKQTIQTAGMVTWCSYHGVFEVPAARAALIAHGGGDSATWGKALLQLRTMELLRIHRPEAEQQYNTEGHRISVELAQQRGNKYPVTWYGIPEYTPEVLERAEAQAMTAAQVRGKDSLRDIVGSEEANRITNTGWGEHENTTHRRRLLLDALTRQLNSFGCAYDADVVAEARQNCPIEQQPERMQPTWLEYRAEAMRTLDLKRGRPTQEEKERFLLDGDSWIIRHAHTER